MEHLNIINTEINFKNNENCIYIYIYHKSLPLNFGDYRHGSAKLNNNNIKKYIVDLTQGNQRENLSKILEISFSAFLDCFRAF